MNRKNIQLIKQSIVEKWNPIALGCEQDRGIINCPLCQEYFENACVGCPVREATGQHCCNDTPYEHMYIQSWLTYQLDQCSLVEAEIEFLISLLPDSEQEGFE